MGITISSKRHDCDLGYGGFGRFRDCVAKNLNNAFSEHHAALRGKESTGEIYRMDQEEQDAYYEAFNQKTKAFIEEGVVSIEVANFLFQSDCDGKINRKQAKQIYRLIEHEKDDIVYGYIGRPDVATMRDLKAIFSDGTSVRWS